MARSSASTKPARDWRIIIAMAAILGLAFALRIIGLRWGLPNELHSYSYHPDEFLTLGAAFSAVYIGRSFDPRFYNYPSLYIYLAAFAVAVAMGYGVANNAADIYLTARVVTVLMGVGAVGATYWAGREMFGKAVGLLAACILAVAPLHVQHSHFATVDVPSTLFIALCLGYSALVMKRGDWRDYILAGAMAGLAAGTKYNAGLVAFAVIAAHLLRDRLSVKALASKKLWAAIGCVFAAFVISTPGSVLRTSSFLYGLTYEMKHASSGHGLVFAGTGNGFVYTFVSSLRHGLGPFLAFIFMLAVIAAVVRRGRMCLLMLAFAVPYYTLISVSQVRFARYTLPLYPVIAILCGWVMVRAWSSLAGKRVLLVLGQWIWGLLCGGAIFYAIFFSLVLDSIFVFHHPQDDAARWIKRHIPKQSSIGMMELPWFYSPPLTKQFGFGAVAQREQAVQDAPYDIVVFSKYEKPGDWWRNGDRPDWVIVSEYEVRDALRLRNNKRLSKEQREEVDRILTNLDIVRKHYTQRTLFGGMYDGDMDLYTDDLPHDMRYASPEIEIYERKK